MIGLVWSLLASLILVGCGGRTQVAQTQNPSPQWTVENPNAADGRNLGSSAEAKRLTSAPSSLEALQSGQSTKTPASSPIKDVYFGFDRYDLTEESRATLKANADWLRSNPAVRVQIEGHCDERGDANYNLALGAKRAQTAKDYLITLGISTDRLSTISYGEEIPVCTEQTEDCWAQNRRARFIAAGGQPTS
ncbi:MAG TPA: peptidoglycan-associated lipoprotein Pal [Candidatus Binatia bacterium]|nr:peptidoglycan-associated lipoprotein Pal [Candidatus Binatia bacterium]